MPEYISKVTTMGETHPLKDNDLVTLAEDSSNANKLLAIGDENTLVPIDPSTFMEVEKYTKYILDIDYNALLAFDTSEIILGNVHNNNTSSVLGTGVLGYMILG